MEVNYYYEVNVLNAMDLPELNLRRVITLLGWRKTGVDEWGNSAVYVGRVELPTTDVDPSSFVQIGQLNFADIKAWALAKITPEENAKADQEIIERLQKKRRNLPQ